MASNFPQRFIKEFYLRQTALYTVECENEMRVALNCIKEDDNSTECVEKKEALGTCVSGQMPSGGFDFSEKDVENIRIRCDNNPDKCDQYISNFWRKRIPNSEPNELTYEFREMFGGQ